MFQTRPRIVSGIRAVADQTTLIPDRAGVHDRIAGLRSRRVAGVYVCTGDRIRPGVAIPEPRTVVISEYAEHRSTKTDRAENDAVRCGHFLRRLPRYPVFVGKMNQAPHSGIDSCDHSRRAHG